MSDGNPNQKFRRLIWLLFLLVIALGMLSTATLWEMRREAWREAIIASRNLVTAEVSDIDQALQIYDASLRSAAEAANDPEIIAAPPRIRQWALFDRIEDPSFLEPIRILNPNGQVTEDSTKLVPAPAKKIELEAVAHHRLDPATETFISLPKLDGIGITGSEVMRHFAEQQAGTIVAPGTPDGIKRVFTFAHLSGWPLLVDVGVSVSDLYAPWRKRAAIVGFLLAVMVIAGDFLVLALRRELSEHLAAEEASRRSKIQYDILADGTSDVILRLDVNLARTYASPSSSVLGYEPGDFTDRSPYEWIHPHDAGTFRDAFNDARNGFLGG